MNEKLFDYLLKEFRDTKIALHKELESSGEYKGNYIALVNHNLRAKALEKRYLLIHRALRDEREICGSERLRRLKIDLQNEENDIERLTNPKTIIDSLMVIEEIKAEIKFAQEIELFLREEKQNDTTRQTY